jgi:hypothetical protein
LRSVTRAGPSVLHGAGHIALDVDHHGHLRTIAFGELDPPADPAAWHEVEVLTPGRGIIVTIDHEQTINKIRAPLARGAVILGIVPGPPGAKPAQVEFAGVTINSTP